MVIEAWPSVNGQTGLTEPLPSALVKGLRIHNILYATWGRDRNNYSPGTIPNSLKASKSPVSHQIKIAKDTFLSDLCFDEEVERQKKQLLAETKFALKPLDGKFLVFLMDIRQNY